MPLLVLRSLFVVNLRSSVRTFLTEKTTYEIFSKYRRPSGHVTQSNGSHSDTLYVSSAREPTARCEIKKISRHGYRSRDQRPFRHRSRFKNRRRDLHSCQTSGGNYPIASRRR